jgi:hypothetical protein
VANIDKNSKSRSTSSDIKVFLCRKQRIATPMYFVIKY